MPLTNAERQRRFREKQLQLTIEKGGAGPTLNAEQRRDRDAVASEPIWPVPRSDQIPRFLGWTRYEWSVAPRELIELVGLVEAWEGWQAEEAAMQAEMRANNAAFCARVDAIVAEVGDRARDLWTSQGGLALIREYEAGTIQAKKRQKAKLGREDA